MDKTALRKQMLQLRSQLPSKFIENSAKRMGGQIAALPAFHDAEVIMLYHSYKNEAGTLSLLQYSFTSGKKVILPVTVKTPVQPTAAPVRPDAAAAPVSVLELRPFQLPGLTALRYGAMGILEPDPLYCREVHPAEIDLIIVPGVAFDVNGGRIGYGKGCYDRFLPQLRPDVPIVGLAYDFQVLPRVPQESADRKVDLIVTEKGILKTPHCKIEI